MLGLPGEGYHLELITHTDGVDGRAPTRDNLLVFYIDDQAAIDALVERLAEHGHHPVAAGKPVLGERRCQLRGPGRVGRGVHEHDRPAIAAQSSL